MIDILALAYTVASIAQIAAGIPQIRKVVKAKNTEAISLTTWGMWSLTQLICLGYHFKYSSTVVIVMSTLWTAYYAAMILLIVYYRWPQFFRFTRVLGVREPVTVVEE